jgi:hypothetical protein
MKPNRYMKKPIVIEAMQYDGSNFYDVIRWVEDCARLARLSPNENIIIETLGGVMICPPGHYIIKGIDGEFRPLEKSVFERIYDIVEKNS